MTSSLFRPEALEFQKQYREFGQVGRLQSSSAKMFAWLLTIAVGALIVFICLAGYTRKETVARLSRSRARNVEHFRARARNHNRGPCRAGSAGCQRAISFSPSTRRKSPPTALDVNAAILKSLALQKTLLANQINEEERTTPPSVTGLTAAITSGEAELAQLAAQMKIQQDQIDLAQQLVDTAEKMHAAGYMAAPELYSRRENLLRARQELSALKQRAVARETELAETRSALEQLPAQSARRLQPLQSELARARPAHRRDGRTPVLLHSRADRRARRQCPSQGRASGRSEKAAVSTFFRSKARSKRCCSFRPAPSGSCAPARRCASSTKRSRSSASAPIPAASSPCRRRSCRRPISGRPCSCSEPAYKVVAVLDRPDVDANGQKIPLQAGMLLRADILLERRELVRWLLDPILNVRM